MFCLLAAAAVCSAQLSYERIRDAHKEPGNWLTYSGNYSGHRYTGLDQVRRDNVARLKLAWVHQARATEPFQTSPVVVDGVMYITEPPNIVKALDLRSNRALWTYQRTIPDDLRLCCGRVNRGVAVLDDKVFYNSIDAHMIALDAATGRLLWDVEMAPYQLGYSATLAPLAVKLRVEPFASQERTRPRGARLSSPFPGFPRGKPKSRVPIAYYLHGRISL